MNKYYVLILSLIVLVLAFIRGMGITFVAMFPFQNLILVGTIILIFLFSSIIVRMFKDGKFIISFLLFLLSFIGFLSGFCFGGYATILNTSNDIMIKYLDTIALSSIIGTLFLFGGLLVCKYLHYAFKENNRITYLR